MARPRSCSSRPNRSQALSKPRRLYEPYFTPAADQVCLPDGTGGQCPDHWMRRRSHRTGTCHAQTDSARAREIDGELETLLPEREAIATRPPQHDKNVRDSEEKIRIFWEEALVWPCSLRRCLDARVASQWCRLRCQRKSSVSSHNLSSEWGI